MNKQMQMNRERVAMGCLACYNEGVLAYKHMDCDELEEAWESEGGLSLAVCKADKNPLYPHEEWHIQDYDGEIGRVGHYLGENPDIPELIELMKLMDDEPDRYVPAFLFATEFVGGTPTTAKVEEMADEMICIDDSMGNGIKEYFMEQAIDCGIVSEDHPVFSYIDWEWYARDCMYDYSEYNYGGDIYLVVNC